MMRILADLDEVLEYEPIAAANITGGMIRDNQGFWNDGS